MRAFKGTCVNKDGKTRHMNFVKLRDLPEAFLKSKLTNGLKKRELTNGVEVVWDLDKESFRIFNYNTVVGSMTEYSYVGLLDSTKLLKNEIEN